jgi:magnesium transporter
MIDAFLLLKDGSLKRSQDVEEVVRLVEEAGDGWTLWLDLEAPPEEEFGLLQALFNFHPLALEDCLAITHHPKIDDFDDHLFLILHAVRWRGEDETVETMELDCFLGSHFLVTHHREPLPSIQEAKVRCLKQEGALSRGADYLLHVVLDTLVDNYSPVLDAIGEVVEAAEEEIFANPKPSALNRLFTLQKELSDLWRLALHQKEILARLSREEFSVIGRHHAIFYRDIYDHLVRVSDLTESYRELILGSMNAYVWVTSSRTNEVMKVLTVFAAVLLPLTLVAAIYGMNFRFMPELDWPYGYYAILGLMASIAAGMLLIFRWKKWF